MATIAAVSSDRPPPPPALADGCRVIIRPTPAACAVTASDIIESVIAGGQEPVLGVATGTTPLLTYDELVRRSPRSPKLQLVLLDEYLGLPPGDDRSFTATVLRLLADPLGIPPDRVHVPPHDDAPTAASCRAFERHLHDMGGVDLQILGIGRNGHIAFNEPGSPLASRTRPVRLAAATRQDNQAAFGDGDRVPERACTQGIGTILEAQRLLLLATGASKAPILRAALLGPVTPDVPASALRLHPDVVVVADEHAAGLLGPAAL